MLWTSLLWRSTVAFTYLKVKSTKCRCLLTVVLVLLFRSWCWSCKQRSWSLSWSCYFHLGLDLKNLVLFTSLADFLIVCPGNDDAGCSSYCSLPCKWPIIHMSLACECNVDIAARFMVAAGKTEIKLHRMDRTVRTARAISHHSRRRRWRHCDVIFSLFAGDLAEKPRSRTHWLVRRLLLPRVDTNVSVRLSVTIMCTLYYYYYYY